MKTQLNTYLRHFLLITIFLVNVQMFAQTGISVIHTETNPSISGKTYTDNGAPNSSNSSTNFTYKYGANSSYNDNEVKLLSFEAGSAAYRYEPIPVEVVFRRVNNPNVSGNRDLMFYFGDRSGTVINLKAPYIDAMSTAFTGNTNLMRGSDNLFANTGDGNGNINNIERLDVIVEAGILINRADAQGFAIMERGGINQHDVFTVAVITSIDGSGNPTSYSSLIRANSGNYGNINVLPNQTSIVLRKDAPAENLKISTNLSGQGIGGIFFSFADFNIPDGATVYGYSVAGGDFPAGGSSADFVDFTNSTYFPLNTSGGGAGGIDMIALTGIVKIIEISGSVYNDINGLTDNLVNGSPLFEADGQQLYINLLNEDDIVIASTTVEADGTYSFSGIPLGNLKLQLNQTQGTAGNAAPAITLPANWVHAGSTSGSGSAAQNNGGISLVNIGGDNISGIDFGIQQRPVAGDFTLALQTNPGNEIFVDVPAEAFSGTDPDGGTIEFILISTYPVGANQLNINGTIYTSGNFPVDGIQIPADVSGQVNWPIQVDPADGNISVIIEYYTVDNAGFTSATNGQVVIPFTTDQITIDNFYPVLGPGTLAFEDLWPGKGDYDFNDMVIDYQFEIISNPSNYVEQVVGTFVLKAFGASFENGFGFQLSDAIDPSDVTVTGYQLTENIATLDGNGTEAGQSKPTIIVFDNAFAHMPHPGIGIGINTTPEAPYVQPVTFTINMQFTPNTVSFNDLDIANFNPFIIVNKVRNHEVHLPYYPPTDLADMSLFGQWEDASDPATGKYYVTATNLPWAINIYESFDYPIEKQDILQVHLKFAEWATSGGVQFPDWYKNLSGYRNQSLIYQIPEE